MLEAARQRAGGSAHGGARGPCLQCCYPEHQLAIVKMSTGHAETVSVLETVYIVYVD